MGQFYFDPSRENEPHALPDGEVWESETYTYDCRRCGIFTLDEDSATGNPDGAICPSCSNCGPGLGTLIRTGQTAWFYWACIPGCLPDSEPMGPFDSETEALADARQ